MLDFPRWKVLSITLGLALLVAISIPSFIPKSVRETWPSWIPQPAINLGLDLAGGSYLLLEGKIDDVVVQLDPVRIKPMIAAIQRSARLQGRYDVPEPRGLKLGSGDDDAVKEPSVLSYLRH